MKQHRWIMALAAVGLLLLALPVRGQDGVDGKRLQPGEGRFTRVGGMASDSTQKFLRFDASGNLSQTDASRDRDYSCTYNNIISNAAMVPQAGVDSSAVVYTGDCKRWYLLVRVNGFGSGAAIPYFKFAFRIRSHIGAVSDSLNTIQWDPSNRVGATTVSDSLVFGAVTVPTAAALGSQEIQLIATSEAAGQAAAVGRAAAPHNYLIPLKDSEGDWYEGTWTSVWVRQLAASANVNSSIVVSLVGKP